MTHSEEPVPTSWRKRILLIVAASAAGLGLGWIALIATGVDLNRQLWKAQEAVEGPDAVGIWRKNNRYGWEHIPGSSGRQREVPDFDVSYSIGADGNRVTPANPARERPVVLFLGGSFTFGHGVEDDEPFPALLQEDWPELHVVNAAVNAWGTTQAMMKLEEQLERESEIQLVVYGFITHHMQRNYRRASWLQKLMGTRDRQSPHFEIENKRLVFKGLLDAQEHGLPDSPQLDQQEAMMTGRVLKKMARLCERRGIPFHVVFLPDGTTNELDRLLRLSVGEQRVTELRPEIDYWSIRFENDVHLKPSGHALLAAALRPVLEARMK